MKIWGVNFLLYCLLLFPSCDDKQESYLFPAVAGNKFLFLTKPAVKSNGHIRYSQEKIVMMLN